jgi:hypothetical protein
MRLLLPNAPTPRCCHSTPGLPACCCSCPFCACPPACRRVHDALENFPRAVRWYKAALQEDALNYEVRPGGRWQLRLFACRPALLRVAL